VLKNLVGGSDTEVINPKAGDKYRFGLIYLDVLFPKNKDFEKDLENYDPNKGDGVLGAFTSNNDPNEYSVVLTLSFKYFDALFTGDIDQEISDTIARNIS